MEQNAFGEKVSGIFHLYQETNKHRAVLSLIWRNDTRRARELENPRQGIVGKRERCVERLGNLVQLVPENDK